MSRSVFLATALCAAGFLTPSSAQGVSLSWTDGALGSSLDYELETDPGTIWILGISTIEGPTPLWLVDPWDTRLLFLGVDLLTLWTSGVVPGDGIAHSVYPLPTDPVLQGLKLHGQAMTYPGVVTIVDELSNTVALRLQMPGTSAATVGKRLKPGFGHTQTALPNGRVLLLGGISVGEQILDVNEVFWPQGQVFVQSPALASGRVGHAAVPIADGDVLLVGGRDESGATSACSRVDAMNDAVTAAASLPSPRSRHTATMLPDGRVLVVGGLAVEDEADAVATLLSALPDTQIYDPVLDTWTAGPSLPKGLIGHAAVLLPDGRVLVSGGVELSSLFGFPLQTWTSAAWLIDPVAGTVTQAADMPEAVAYHASVVPSADGRAVVTGGERIDPFFLPVYVSGVHRYDAGLDQWVTLNPLNHPRGHHAMVEAAGQLVVVGGIGAYDAMTLVETTEDTAEVTAADLSGLWGSIDLMAPRGRARATAIDGGLRVLVTGGAIDGEPNPTAEIVMP